MPLSVGTRLGPYEILAPIGAGGMGEVYRARDSKLDRDVAIKVLPQTLAQDPERLARFEREAKVLAALNHPNIAQIYGLEQRALVMELVEGETLKGPLPLEIALNYAKQIADALEAAHEKGITHRDLKPANIMITPAGVVKVLDFGLAAVAQDPASGSTDPSNSPTLTMRATQAGMIMGTAAYMSPEQAAGKPVDKRADIWSFGVVLFELLTGHQLFGEGETISHTLADVLRAPIDFERLPKETPSTIRSLLRRCLDRDVKSRLRDIGEARLVISGVGKEPEAPATERSRSWLRVASIGTGILLVALAGVSWIAYRATRPTEPKPLVRLDVDLGSDVALGTSAGAAVIISPDGTRLVYVSRNRLFTRRLDQSKGTELAGTDGAFAPFFSPDGQWVAFFTPVGLKKVSVDGGAAITLARAPSNARGGSWGEDGDVIAAFGPDGSLSRVSSTGGLPTPIAELAPGEAGQRWPQVLPGGKAVLFSQTRGFYDGSSIEVLSLGDHRRKTLQRGGTFGRYVATSRGAGHLVYFNKGTLFAVPFDLVTLTVRGTPVPLLQDVAYDDAHGSAQFDVSSSGTLVYRSGGALTGGQLTVQWLDSAGKTQPLLARPGMYQYPRVSPDGQRLAVSYPDIWVYEPQRDTMTRLSFNGGFDPVWSPDGRYIAFGTERGIFWTRSDGAGKPQPLIQSKGGQIPYSFTPDGKRLAYQERTNAGLHLWTVPVESDGVGLRAGKPELFLETPFNDRGPVFSPDGRWLAYASDESGSYQIYVRPFPGAPSGPGGKWQISNNGGIFPVWARNGGELFFRSEDNHIMAAAYSVKGDSFVAEKARIWTEKTIADIGQAGTNFDVSPDGKRVAALMPVERPEDQKAQNHVIFLLNFFDELRRRVPAGGK